MIQGSISLQKKIIRIFVTKSNYIFRALNDIYRVTLEFYTDSDEYKICNNSLIYTYKMNLYEYYYEDNFKISLPNKEIVYINKNKESYDNLGLIKDRYDKGCIRDKLYVRYILNLEKPNSKHKDLIKRIFHER